VVGIMGYTLSIKKIISNSSLTSRMRSQEIP
jgi:hypothetical protein